jgi:putative membrane protein
VEGTQQGPVNLHCVAGSPVRQSLSIGPGDPIIRTVLIVSVAAVALGLSACNKTADTNAGATADNGPTTADATAPAPAVAPAAPTAADFVPKAGATDMFEIAEAKLALKHSSSAKVKAFASMMITDHTKSTAALKAAIAKSGQTLPLPAALPADMQSKVDALGQTAAGDFDKVYLADQVDAHQTALGVMQAYAAAGDVPDLKTFATNTTTVVQRHLARATELQSTVK